MKLIKGRSYTSDCTDLKLTILSNVFYNTSKTKMKFKACLSNKNNGIIYETKQYKLDVDIPKKYGWFKCS